MKNELYKEMKLKLIYDLLVNVYCYEITDPAKAKALMQVVYDTMGIGVNSEQ